MDKKSRNKVSKKAAKLKLKKRKLTSGADPDKTTEVSEGFSGNNLGSIEDKKSRNKESKKAANVKLKKRKFINEAGLDKSTEVNEGFSGNNNHGAIEEDRSTSQEPGSKKGMLSSRKRQRREKAKKTDENAGVFPHKYTDTLGETIRMERKVAKIEEKHLLMTKIKLEENSNKNDDGMVDRISAVDEDSSRGMKKWLIEHKQRRAGQKILQQRIDKFIIAHEEEQEQERKEREARAAEGGWTVVVHHKGRKKTTEAETGVTVGSVAKAAVMDKMAKKKAQEPASNFYRFQRREAQRNEVMMLQSKFEQDRRRIQQLRSERKFRPY